MNVPSGRRNRRGPRSRSLGGGASGLRSENDKQGLQTALPGTSSGTRRPTLFIHLLFAVKCEETHYHVHGSMIWISQHAHCRTCAHAAP